MSMGQAQTVLFSLDQTIPYIFRGYVVRWDFVIAIVIAVIAWFVMSRSLFGFSVRVVGSAPHAARYGGFSEKRTIWLVLLVSGGLAGLAGILEATGPFGRLIPEFPQQYGFTAIIVAFLGRLHPLGVIIAALVLALTFVGGEVAQITIRLPEAGVFILQALVLFLLLSGDMLVRYRLRVVSTERAKAEA
jgi:simple sugar transport system permease protein